MTRRTLFGLALAALFVAAVYPLGAQVASDRILRAAGEPQNWLTYNGAYDSQRYSALARITPANVATLESKWVLQDQVFGAWQSNPLVVDGIMYLTERPNDVMAVDAKTGRMFWLYRYTPSPDARVCCGANNRGVAILGDTLYLGTLDAHLVAIDAKNGRPLWDKEVAPVNLAYSITLAPLIVKDKVIVGVGGGEFGIRGFMAAYDPTDGHELWRFSTVPEPGEPGSDTWSGDAWKTGGGSVWVTGSYDPDLNLTYWGVGNPGPDWNPVQRPGDNLYTDSVVALDADTGELKWHFQFTPNDGYDYDSVQVPVLVDRTWHGEPRKLMLWANRNGYFYVLDRTTGKFLLGKPFVKVNWSSGLDENGRPIQTPQPPGHRPGRATRAAPTGIRRRTARAPVSSTSPPGRTTPPSTGAKNPCISRGGTSPAAASPCLRRCRGRPRWESAGAARSTPGPTPSGTARCSPSIPKPATHAGTSINSTSPTAAC